MGYFSDLEKSKTRYTTECVCVCVSLRYVIVECEDQDTQQRDPKTHEMYLNVMRRFSQALLKVRAAPQHRQLMSSPSDIHVFSPPQGDKSVRVMRSLLAAQQTFVNRLVQLMKAVQRESGNRKKKVRQHMQAGTQLQVLFQSGLWWSAML